MSIKIKSLTTRDLLPPDHPRARLRKLVERTVASIIDDSIDGGDFILMNHVLGLPVIDGDDVFTVWFDSNRNVVIGWLGNEHDPDKTHLLEEAL